MSQHHKDRSAARARAAWLDATDRRCWCCGFLGADTVDHRVALALGGLDHPSNWAPAHRRCNSSKGVRLAPAPPGQRPSRMVTYTDAHGVWRIGQRKPGRRL